MRHAIWSITGIVEMLVVSVVLSGFPYISQKLLVSCFSKELSWVSGRNHLCLKGRATSVGPRGAFSSLPLSHITCIGGILMTNRLQICFEGVWWSIYECQPRVWRHMKLKVGINLFSKIWKLLEIAKVKLEASYNQILDLEMLEKIKNLKLKKNLEKEVQIW